MGLKICLRNRHLYAPLHNRFHHRLHHALFWLLCYSFLGLILGCQLVEPVTEDNLLDGPIIIDSSLVNPAEFLVSQQALAKNLDTPVVICIHGFTATTFEWLEFKEFADSLQQFRVSLVLLGGHGRDYESFKKSTWKDWAKPIWDEYAALKEKGYRNISFACSSTGCPLLLYYITENRFKELAPKEIIFVDPIVITKAKSLSLVSLVGWLIGNDINEQSDEEKAYWYTSRPMEALSELMSLCTLMRKRIENGIKLPAQTRMKVMKSKVDEVVSPLGALLLYKGLRHSDGSRIEVEMLESRLHVFTRLRGRANVSEADMQNQKSAFQDIAKRVLE